MTSKCVCLHPYCILYLLINRYKISLSLPSALGIVEGFFDSLLNIDFLSIESRAESGVRKKCPVLVFLLLSFSEYHPKWFQLLLYFTISAK